MKARVILKHVFVALFTGDNLEGKYSPSRYIAVGEVLLGLLGARLDFKMAS